MKTFVVTNPELGWDCIIGVYQAKSKTALIKWLRENDSYDKEYDIIHQKELVII
jgi:ATP adenylyltransferase/5',5'''-P-1,P-4-tetraphosphate phosphorylase II